MAQCRTDPGRARHRVRRRAEPALHLLHGSDRWRLFKTENCGETWTPISDGQISTGSIGSIDVSESNPSIVYVGTGSAAIRSNVIIGRGAYKSIDAGRTWQFIGLEDAGQIGSIIVHPTNPDVVWARGARLAVRAERRTRRLQDDRRREDAGRRRCS